MSKNLRAHVFLFLANLIYGLSFTIAKDIVPHYIKPFGIIVIRVSCALVLFFITRQFFTREKVERKDYLLLAACGLFGVATNQLLFYKGLAITAPINAALIMTTTPILILIFSGLFKDERITALKVAGILTGMCGAMVVIVFGHSVSFDSGHAMGDILIMLNASSYAVYLVIVKPLMKKYHPVTVLCWVFFFGWLVVLPVGWNEFSHIDWHIFTDTTWYGLAFIVVATTFFTYLLNVLALRNANPSLAGIYIYLQPAMATIFAIVLGKDELNIYKLVATLLIFAGVYMVSMKEKRRNGEVENAG